MKATLEFNMDEIDDVTAHKRAVKSLDMILVLSDFDNHLRSELKYNEKLSEVEYDILDKTREKLYEIMNEHNVSIDELLR
jgi:hypothetical protein